MTYDHIQNDEIIERYLLRKLSPEEEQLFEEHYFSCDACFAQVKEAEKVIYAIKDAARRGVLVTSGATTRSAFAPLWERIESLLLRPAFALGATVLAIALLYPAWQGLVTLPRLQNELQPQANAPSYQLEYTTNRARAGEGKIAINAATRTFILNFVLLEKKTATPKYRAEIVDDENKIVWRTETLKPVGEFGGFSIACHSSFFAPGNYVLKVYEIDPAEGQAVDEFLFPFVIVPESERSKP